MIYVSETDQLEPRYSSVYSGSGFIFGKNIKNWDKNETKYLNGSDDWTKTSEWDFNTVPQREYYIQVVWVQNRDTESQINSPGNLYSEPIRINTKN